MRKLNLEMTVPLSACAALLYVVFIVCVSFPAWCFGQDMELDLSVPGVCFTKVYMT